MRLYVRSFAVDLRDGVRLCRLVEVLAGAVGDDGCVRDAKFPADSRRRDAQRATGAGRRGRRRRAARQVEGRVPADVVDSHLANTLGLLYALMMRFRRRGCCRYARWTRDCAVAMASSETNPRR